MGSLETVGGVQYFVWRDELHNVMTVDYPRNPSLWFAKRLTEPRDMICTGTETRRECMEIVSGTCELCYDGETLQQLASRREREEA